MKDLPRLHAVTTREILERPDFIEAALRVLALGRTALHLRAWGASGRLLLDRAREIRGEMPAATLIVNDRVDVAAIAGTGAHLPEAGLTAAQARSILGSEPLVGRSLHAPPQGAPAGLDYVFYGHVFESSSKPGSPPRGLQGLAEVVSHAARWGLPVIAVGGVIPERITSLVEVGAHGVAAISGIWEQPDPASAAALYLEALAAAPDLFAERS